MATLDEVAMLRRMTDVSDEDSVYTEDVRASIIDSSESIEAAAAQVWTEKAARFAGAVDMSESGSSRSLSQLQKQALEMRKQFSGSGNGTSKPSGGSFTVEIERI
jgi:hypothetical protein